MIENYKTIAGIFTYPDKNFPEKIRRASQVIAASYPEAHATFEQFIAELPTSDLHKMEELYVRSFEVQSVTTLEVGYVCFGDDYKRGELLANLNNEYRKFPIDCHNELGDHMSNILVLIAHLKENADSAELAQDLVQEIVAPAIYKMLTEFDPGRVEDRNKFYQKQYKTLIDAPNHLGTAYGHALRALYEILKTDYIVTEKHITSEARGFLGSLGEEINIEGMGCGGPPPAPGFGV